MCLLARALELAAIPTAVAASRDGIVRKVKPPRVALTRQPRGAPLGMPDETEQQRRVLEACLQLLERPAPAEPVVLAQENAPSA